tara:strand:- start:263 stop:496 length:234 start_codon:yes stop_codon:yes gene_type:complete
MPARMHVRGTASTLASQNPASISNQMPAYQKQTQPKHCQHLVKTFARNLSRNLCQHFAREIIPEKVPVIFSQSLSNI